MKLLKSEFSVRPDMPGCPIQYHEIRSIDGVEYEYADIETATTPRAYELLQARAETAFRARFRKLTSCAAG